MVMHTKEDNNQESGWSLKNPKKISEILISSYLRRLIIPYDYEIKIYPIRRSLFVYFIA